MATIHLVYEEVSDQYGTSKVVGGYSSPELAEEAQKLIKRSRSHVEKIVLDAPPIKLRT